MGAEELYRAAEGWLKGYMPLERLTDEGFEAGAEAVFQAGLRFLPDFLRKAGRSGAMLLSVALLCALAEPARETLGGEGLDPVRLAGAAAVCAIAAADVNSLMTLGRQSMGQLKGFSQLLLPTVTAACAAAGAPAAAAARQGATLLFFDLLLTLSERFLLPLIYAYVALLTAHGALGNEGLRRMAGILRWTANGLLSLLLSLFVFYLTFTGAVAGNADALAQKAAKTALSGMVPVVGDILSDAAETVVAGAGVLKGTVGVVGLVTVLALCLTPFLQMGCHYLVYKLTAALAATVAPGPAASLMDAIGSAFAMMMGMVGGSGIILYVALVTSVKAVSAG